ncbi:MAG: SCO family protein [Bacteroidales bacterium]|nr:SCO family protein [Bacteroidales bacterium]
MNKTFLISISVLALLPHHLQAQALQPRYQTGTTEIGIEERLDEYISDDIMLINTSGENVRLYDFLDKPTVIALVYYRCPGICSPFMGAMADVISRSDLEPGKDFQILNISFDPREGPELAHNNRNNYFNLLTREINPDGWQFFVTDSLNAARLTDAVGFRYKRAGLDFLHTAAMIFVSEEGKITRYLHGTYFLPIDLKMAVIETAAGRSGPSFSRVLAYCFSYDPEGQRYVLNLTKIAGTLILFFALLIFGGLIIFKPKRKHT